MTIKSMTGLLFGLLSQASSSAALEMAQNSYDRSVEEEQQQAQKRQQHTAALLGMQTAFRDKLKDGGKGPEMVVIPSGQFLMGSPDNEADRYPNETRHRVTVSRPFALGKYEVTVAEYLQCVEADGCPLLQWLEEGDFNLQMGEDKDQFRGFTSGGQPMVGTFWYGMERYAQWLSEQTGERYRLPTEAEWEYAARGGTTSAYYWGNRADCRQARYHDAACGEVDTTAKVGSYPANPFGLHDMAGNVWEWTCSRYEKAYQGQELVCADADYVTDDNNFYRTVKGGSWMNPAATQRSAVRDWTSQFPSDIEDVMILVPNRSIGARVMRELPSAGCRACQGTE